VTALGFAKTAEDSWDNLKQLQPGQRIEVVDTHLKSLKGVFVSLSDDAISLRTDEKEVAVERPEVLRVWAEGQGHRLRNTILGTLIGGGAAALMAAKTRKTAAHEATVVAIGFGGGAAGGAALPTGGWRVVYRRR